MTGMIRFAVVITLSLLLLQPLVAKIPPEQFTIKVGVELINVLFTVTDQNGRLVDGLGPEDFVVEEDGEEQTIQHFASENELPLTLALLVDTSPSVEPVLREEQRTAREFLESTLRSQDLALVMGFDRSVTLMQDFTESGGMLGDAIDDLRVGSGTSIFDAIFLASEDRLQYEAGRKAIILISDGEDTTSRVRRNEALISAHQADAVIYSISNTLPRRGGFFGGGGQRTGDLGTLRRLSEETGGAVFELDSRDDFAEIFARIAAELRNQYSLAYVSTNPNRDGEYREIRIRPRDRDLRVRARQGYYATSDDDQ
jgi:Ca-activated chloride channel family protein